MPKSGKIICATFFAKSLDKMLAVWYNGISGAGAREGTVNYTPYSGFCQVGIMHKNRVEKFSTPILKNSGESALSEITGGLTLNKKTLLLSLFAFQSKQM
jgi:hypothetical protein